MSGADFQWYGNLADVVVPEQFAIAVYPNADGDIVIRQKGDAYEEPDATIIVSRSYAEALAQALVRTAAEAAAIGDRP